MIFKYFLLASLAALFITASDPFYGTELILKPLPKENPEDVKERIWMETDAYRKYLDDHDGRVSDTFKVDSFFYPNVNFWFLIYTQFSSSSVVLHDRENLSLIYKVLDFSSLHKKELSKNIIYVVQTKISHERLDDMRSGFDVLIKDPFSLTEDSKNILQSLQRSKVKMPLKKIERIAFFRKLKENLRTQTGQKNFIRDGVIRSLPYQAFLQKYFTDKKLPTELLAIPFLESSFNPRAHSKANALGIWQFMPLIASYYMPKRSIKTDFRYNVGVASVGAGFLMSENMAIMKSWDMAVTAYNSGTKHLLKTKRELASKKIDLEDIIRHSKSSMFGFASKNFYSEFLALAHTLAYKDELFEDLHDSDRSDVDDNLNFFLTRCSFRLEKELDNRDLEDVVFHNHQLHGPNENLPKGFIVTTKRLLPKKLFYQIKYSDVLKIKPKDWQSFIKNQSCSTR
jgi:membrane-bound lytic murein transglycosylase D